VAVNGVYTGSMVGVFCFFVIVPATTELYT